MGGWSSVALPVPFVLQLPPPPLPLLLLLLLPMLVPAVLFFLPLLLLSDSVIWMDKPPTRTRGIRRTSTQGIKLSSWKRRRTHSICVRSFVRSVDRSVDRCKGVILLSCWFGSS